jgi:hypothetical protein
MATMPGAGERLGFWLRVLIAGVKPLDTVARLIAVIGLLLALAGITVTFVLHLAWPWTLVILVGLLLLVVLEGAYRVWHETDQERQEHQRVLAEKKPVAIEASVKPLEPRYLQREPYRLPNANMVHHRIGIFNPAGNPEATGVRLQWIEMSPRPRKDFGRPPVIPQAVPMKVGGDPGIGISLHPGQEELWVIGTTATDDNGAMTVGFFGPGRSGWRGTPWYFEPHDRWRLTYRIVADNVPGEIFSVVMNAVDGWIRCDLEG